MKSLLLEFGSPDLPNTINYSDCCYCGICRHHPIVNLRREIKDILLAHVMAKLTAEL